LSFARHPMAVVVTAVMCVLREHCCVALPRSPIPHGSTISYPPPSQPSCPVLHTLALTIQYVLVQLCTKYEFIQGAWWLSCCRLLEVRRSDIQLAFCRNYYLYMIRTKKDRKCLENYGRAVGLLQWEDSRGLASATNPRAWVA
jgi:hypothetical protein